MVVPLVIVKIKSHNLCGANTVNLYDANGNLTQDLNKNITDIKYSWNNLPEHILLAQDNQNTIDYLYDAAGTKLRRVTSSDQAAGLTSDYSGKFVYSGASLSFIQMGDYRIVPEGNGYEVRFYLRDHLCNVRVEFKQDAYGEATITQENHYYPFGMRFSGEVFANNDNDFRYNGKELQDDFGLDWYDYGARFYDPALGRWHAVDPLADKAPGWTPYRYGFNNPMSFIDPDGRAEREGLDGWLVNEGIDKKINEIDWIIQSVIFNKRRVIISRTVKKGEGETATGSDKGEGKEGGNEGDDDNGEATNGGVGPEFSGSLWDWVNKLNHLGQRRWTDPESGISYYINDAGEITGVYPITGMAPAPGMGKGLKVLQTGGRTLSSRTLKGLNLSKDQGKRAIERMKKANGMRNDFHGKIYNNGDVYDDLGNLIDNILDYIH